MSTISVTFREIEYDPVCLHYNTHKSTDWNAIRRLDRIEGGFCIDLNHSFNEDEDANKRIAQVRWNQKQLITPFGCIGFTDKQTFLLYESLKSVYGEDQVKLIFKR